MTPGEPFVLVGEALVDIVVPVGGEPTDAPGGSPLNVAVGLSRLGLDTLLVTELGDDGYGKLVRDHVVGAGVRLDEHSVVPGRRTSTATAHLDAHSAATYDFDLSWTLGRRVLPPDARKGKWAKATADTFTGKTVRATGTIKLNKDAPQLEIADEKDLEVVE